MLTNPHTNNQKTSRFLNINDRLMSINVMEKCRNAFLRYLLFIKR